MIEGHDPFALAFQPFFGREHVPRHDVGVKVAEYAAQGGGVGVLEYQRKCVSDNSCLGVVLRTHRPPHGEFNRRVWVKGLELERRVHLLLVVGCCFVLIDACRVV